MRLVIVRVRGGGGHLKDSEILRSQLGRRRVGRHRRAVAHKIDWWPMTDVGRESARSEKYGMSIFPFFPDKVKESHILDAKNVVHWLPYLRRA